MTLRIVCLIMLGASFVINMTRSIISLFASELGASTFQIGTMTAAYALFPFIIALHAGKIVDRLGDRIPVMFGMIGMSAGVLIPYLFPSVTSLYISQGTIGMSHVFVVIALQNVIGKTIPKEKRDQAFGLFSTMVSVSSFLGPITGGYLAQHYAYTAVFLASVFVCILPVLFSLFIPVIRKTGVRENFSLLESASLLKKPALRNALISSALVLYSRDIFVIYFPLYADSLGIKVSTIGWLISLQGMAMILIRVFLARLTGFLGRGRVLIASIVIAGISFLLVPFTASVTFLGVWSALMGVGLGCGQPLSMATSYNESPAARTGEVLGLRLTINRLSQLVAPVFFGIVGAWIGILSVFLLSGSFLLGGTLLVRAKRKQPSTPPD